MRHPKQIEWEHQLKKLFDEIDDVLEERYGKKYRLHPNRPEQYSTANKEMDGLFNVGADFTAGYGSKYGRGYAVNIHMSTQEHVSTQERESICCEVELLLKNKLSTTFPIRNLDVVRDGVQLKIVGNFSLGLVNID